MATQTFNFIGETIQVFIVPPGISSVTIRAVGAGGGIGSGGGTVGLPASVQGDFSVVPGQTLSIMVGERGHTAENAAGGGGGSFVWSGTVDNLLVAAGGGGGAGYVSPPEGNGLDANFNSGNGVSGSSGGKGGTGGSGGEVVFLSAGSGSGGAGVFGSGWSNTIPLSGGGIGINHLINPGRGGSSAYGGTGGYGGGGGGSGGGGGGGGYSGGGGGNGNGGGGGGSMNYGANPVNLLSSNTGNGLVEISYEAVIITRGVPF